ncbi:hypothetical protein [Streptomyces sp. NPDC059957]|uniref:hypothetical protein n=1 Tax=unclassified Streptomyces TaxID=2593676 RepID=UPI003658DD1C
MWRLPDSAAQRFPLIARPRPACLPLPQRVRTLVELADTAARLHDPSIASTVYNQAALIASDVGIPGVARAMCHQHAAAYLDAAPLSGKAAIRALEPLINLARLQIRSGQPEAGLQRLLTLFNDVSTGTRTQVEDIVVPAHLTANAEDRQEVRALLWRVLLADGTRALTTAGRWKEALAHVKAHRGIGQRMLDGRQVAVLAALDAGDRQGANKLLADTEPGESWENIITLCLSVLYLRKRGMAWRHPLQRLVTSYLERPDEEGITVFNVRLGLALLDTLPCPTGPTARLLISELHRRTKTAADGYAAREALSHPLFPTHATTREAEDCHNLVLSCALETGALPNELRGQLSQAVRISYHTIRQGLAEGQALLGV